ncbi:MAG: hypothetical protein M1834_008215 [Cirrosporium novae-zelandiae]|nr:MAG: hypothetical protein M1834_008215 [Cirrosporium novae-zelandiae]
MATFFQSVAEAKMRLEPLYHTNSDISEMDPLPSPALQYTSLTCLTSSRQGFGRGSSRNAQSQQQQQQQRSTQNVAPSHNAPSPTIPPLTPSASITSNMGSESNNANHSGYSETDLSKFFFKDKYAGFVVKGNFMTLAALPKNVDLGEWLAHQVVEQYRLLTAMLHCVQEVDTNTGLALCNPRICPQMSAGRGHVYTWLDNKKQPVAIPACQYIAHVQRWIVGKVKDARTFPTEAPTGATSYASGDVNTPGANTPIAMGPTTSNAPLSSLAGHDWVGKTGGFPESFFKDCQNIFRQMFRCYAHLYHGHWIDPFWHINKYMQLNTSFVHFVTVAKLFKLLSSREMEPMQPLIDIWVANGSIPAELAGAPPSPTSTS